MKKSNLGFTLIELLIVIAIIGILAAIAIPMYQMRLYKARLVEVTNSMGHVASAVAAYRQENGTWPPNTLDDATEIQNTLGVAIPIGSKYIAGASVVANTGVITFTIKNTGGAGVDENTLSLIPSLTGQDAIVWYWSGGTGFPENLIPKR